MKLNEIIVISGKGGTGKTMLTASIVPYLDEPVIGDCDVDAPDLHILLNPKNYETSSFSGSKKAGIDKGGCSRCNLCRKTCAFNAITDNFRINHLKCEGCGVCVQVCPNNAIELYPIETGSIMTADTEYGPMIHARLIPGEETSGKLVTEVRKRTKLTAYEKGLKTVLIDGSPGIACNVISSLTGASKAVIVTEPTISGIHDLGRVIKIVRKFNIKIFIVINKYNLSKSGYNKLLKYCQKNNLEIDLKIPFHKKIVETITQKKIPSLFIPSVFNSDQWKNFISKLKAYD